MKQKIWTESKSNKLVNKIFKTYEDKKGINHIEGLNLPNRKIIYTVLEDFFDIIFPGYIGQEIITKSNIKYYIGEKINDIYLKLGKEIEKSLRYQCKLNLCNECECDLLASKIVVDILNQIPNLREIIKTDVQAAYDGDPAAKTFDEIILSYPCVDAITSYRIAHELYIRDVPLISRIITEYAHSKTGIDIHPGAKIGKSFFIDHGTGVVVGETCDIGRNVKIYQGVTLGALSFKKDKEGRVVKGEKRHPTIKDNVTIYAGATILGGKTIIGKGAVIGGNVWLTESVLANTKITISKPELVIN